MFVITYIESPWEGSKKWRLSVAILVEHGRCRFCWVVILLQRHGYNIPLAGSSDSHIIRDTLTTVSKAAHSHYKYNLKIICIWKIQNLFLLFHFAINNWRLIRLSSNNLIRRDVLKWLFLQMVNEQEIQFNAQRTSVNQRRSSVSCDCTLGLSEMKRVI